MIDKLRLFDIPYYQLQNNPNDNMFVSKKNGNWNSISTKKFLDTTMDLSMGLIALGIKKGDKVGIISSTRYEWNLMDISIQQIGAIVVPFYPNISEKDYLYIINDSGIKLCIVENEELFLKIKKIKNNTPSLKNIYSMDEIEGCKNWIDLAKLKETIKIDKVQKEMNKVKQEDLATIIYTSGTTGYPKGVMLSHKNIISNIAACIDPIPAKENSKVLSFLPVCHIYERMLHYLYIYLGCSIYFAESLETIGENIKEVKPDVFTAVPRLIEKVFNKIMAKGDELKGIKRQLFFWAVKVAEEYRVIGRSPIYNIKLKIARKLIFSKWKEALGGNIKAIASGSAPLQPRLAKIFIAANIPILEGYGLTETSPVISVNCFKKGIRIGTVGALIEGVEVKIANDGEILVKGPNVMMGYYNNPEATSNVIKDGWFHTGDIGAFEEEKYLKITDRKKEIFKTSGGKYIAPQAMENRFKESRFIEQIIVIGEGQRFPSALIFPDFNFIRQSVKNDKINSSSNKEIANSKEIRNLIDNEVKQINKEYGNWEKLKRIQILENEMTIERGELTPTLKLKRKKILEIHDDKVKKIYE